VGCGRFRAGIVDTHVEIEGQLHIHHHFYDQSSTSTGFPVFNAIVL